MVTEKNQKLSTRGLLLLAGLITVVAWQFHWGQIALYPFTLLATYAHEMGHGITALLFGAEFRSLKMYSNGSGVAQWAGDVGRIGRALIAAGGLVGPSIAGALILSISRRRERSPYLLFLLGGFMVLSVVMVVRNLFGIAFVLSFAALLVVVAIFAKERVGPFLVQLLGVQLCLSVFRDIDYMFSEGALVDGVQHLSDSGQIAETLFLPYWFWGTLVAIFSFVVLGLGLFQALRAPPDKAGESES